jgi:hypothetical protein
LVIVVILRLCFLPTAEELYKTRIVGPRHKTVQGKRAAKLVLDASIQKVIDNPVCCSSGQCLKKWIEDHGDEVAKAVIATERGAYAAMSETARRVGCMKMLQALRVPVMETTPDGQKIVTGRLG